VLPTFANEGNEKSQFKVNKMKVRMIVAPLVFALAAWVPVPAQQNSTPPSATQRMPSAAENSGKATSKAGCLLQPDEGPSERRCFLENDLLPRQVHGLLQERQPIGEQLLRRQEAV
jgi:hypothetical protein